MLMQDKRPVAYASRQLKVHEKNYPKRLGVSGNCVFPQDMEALFVWGAVSGIQRS